MFLNSKVNPFSLSKRINRPLILDGAMGSLLQQRGLKVNGSMWMSLANIENPEIVFQIHKDYINAGSDIVTTNTFRTNPAVTKGFKLDNKSLVRKSVEIAKEAVGDLPVFVAGSNAPAEDCYQVSRTLSHKELEYNHHKHISLLYENGVDFILNETQSHFDEIKIICKYCYKNDIPYIISIFLENTDNILSKDKLLDVIKYISNYEPIAIGFNCIQPKLFFKLIPTLNLTLNWGTYLNLGSGNYTNEKIETFISSDEYKKSVKKVLKNNPSFVGACCGSTPEHIKEIKKLLDE